MLVEVADLFSPSQLFARFVFRACRVRACSLSGRLVVPVTSSYSSINARRANVQRESRSRPTENGFANLTLLRRCWHFADHDSKLTIRLVSKRNLQITVCFNLHSDNAARSSLSKPRNAQAGRDAAFRHLQFCSQASQPRNTASSRGGI